MKPTLIVIVVLVLSVVANFDEVKITIDHNANNAANQEFKFKNVPSPVKDDAAAKAKLVLIDGEIDGNGADLVAVTDGVLPADRDEPAANFFFNAGTSGGRFRLDFGRAIDVAQVNTYSWHPNTRGPQIYKLYGSDGTYPNFNPDPNRRIDPTTVGWGLIASVNTSTTHGVDGGQYAVGISSSAGTLGRYRHLMFDCYVTETNDDWGNTFYSEIDVIEKK
ncbi:MAG TPA: hypothetical protein VLA93_16680 [Pyrinomonadaceae bacterium]|nr:hypothetical protein [Pyrinomonadaceae bacterium]